LLQELADLVRHQSSMDQHASVKMNQMVVRIKSSIENLNTRIDDASNRVSRKRNAGQADQQAANLVNGLQEHFAEAANDFKNILQERTDVMEEQRSMQKQVYTADEDDDEIPNLSMTGPPPVFSNNHNNMGFPSLDLTSNLMAAGQPTGSLPRPHGISYSGGGSGQLHQRRTTGGIYGGMAPLTPQDIQRQEEEMQLQTQLIPEQDYLQQRADAMATVEASIAELGTVFNRLAVMVNEQGHMVQRVDDNVQDANANMNLAMQVLTDTLTSLRTNRMLALRVFAVLLVFIIGFIIFAA